MENLLLTAKVQLRIILFYIVLYLLPRPSIRGKRSFLFFFVFFIVRNEFNESDKIPNLKIDQNDKQKQAFLQTLKNKKKFSELDLLDFSFAEQSNDSDKFLTNSQTVKMTKTISKTTHFHKRPKTKKKFSELDCHHFSDNPAYFGVFSAYFQRISSVFSVDFQLSEKWTT